MGDALTCPRFAFPIIEALAIVFAAATVVRAQDVRLVDELGAGGQSQRIAGKAHEWPWSSIGSVAVTMGRARRGSCTGTLIGPRHVLTAAHCLYNASQQRWAHPHEVHFLAGYVGGSFEAHAVAASWVRGAQDETDGAFKNRSVASDWAIITLTDALPLRPVPRRSLQPNDLATTLKNAELVSAGYRRDHAHLLTVHDGCRITGSRDNARVLMHSCVPIPGDSGGPLLMFQNDQPVIVGINSGFLTDGDGKIGVAVSAAAFDDAARSIANQP